MGGNPDTIVPGQETLVTETPPVEAVPEEPAPETETPGQPDSAKEEVVATTAEAEEKPEKTVSGVKTPEQIEQDRKHFQTEMQKAKEELKALKVGQADEAPQALADKAPRGILAQDEYASLTDDELRERLSQDPILAMRVQREQTRSDIREAIHEARIAERQELELQQANRIFNQFRASNNVPDEIVQSAKQSIKELGVRGAPAAITELLIDQINYRMMIEHGRSVTRKAEAAATETVKKQLLTIQPSAGGGALKEPDPGQALADLIAPKTTN